jgi:hypothetical protein
MPSPTSAPLAEFWRFATDFRSLTAWAAKAMLVAPFVDLALNVGPPWPSRAFNSTVICIIEILILIYAFEFWRHKKSQSHTRRIIQNGLIVLGMCFFVYLILFSQFIEDAYDRWHRVVIGYVMHPNIAEMVLADPIKWTPRELLLQFHDEMAIWTPNSIKIMRCVMLLSWSLMWGSLGVVIAAFVARRWQDSVSQIKNPRQAPHQSS